MEKLFWQDKRLVNFFFEEFFILFLWEKVHFLGEGGISEKNKNLLEKTIYCIQINKKHYIKQRWGGGSSSRCVVVVELRKVVFKIK